VSLRTELRSRFDQLQARVRSLGVVGTLTIEREVLRRILKTTLAATLAWLAAEAIGSPRPALAALAAIIVLQITVRASLTRSVQLTVAVALGLGAAIGLGHVLGLHWWSITLVVLLGLIAGELLRLGTLSGQVAISAMLALSLGSGYGIERTVDTAIGAFIALLVNALISPVSYVSEASRTLRAIGEDLSALLADMGSGLAKGANRESFRRWLTRARDLSAMSREAIAVVKQGEESLQFNPLARGDLAHLSRLTEARRALDHAITQTRGIARSLLDLPEPLTGPEFEVALPMLGRLITEAGRAVAAFGRLQESPDRAADRTLLRELPVRLRVVSADAIHVLERMQADHATAEGASAQQTLDSELAAAARLLVSVFVDVDRLISEVDIVSGQHRAAVTISDDESAG
jgi:uncharacterized membrane protein YgaE (UPF0421/DUF939 family)